MSLTSATATASAQNFSNAPSFLDAILAALSGDSQQSTTGTSSIQATTNMLPGQPANGAKSAIPVVAPIAASDPNTPAQPVSAGVHTKVAETALQARAQAELAARKNRKLQSLKVVTPAQLAMLAGAAMQTPQQNQPQKAPANGSASSPMGVDAAGAQSSPTLKTAAAIAALNAAALQPTSFQAPKPASGPALNPQAAMQAPSSDASAVTPSAPRDSVADETMQAFANVMAPAKPAANAATPVQKAPLTPAQAVANAAAQAQTTAAAKAGAQANPVQAQAKPALEALNPPSNLQAEAAAELALQGVRVTASDNPTNDQLAKSQQQAFANLRPKQDAKATETEVLKPNMDTAAAKADTRDQTRSDSTDNKDDNSTTNTAQPAFTPQGPDPKADPQPSNVAISNAASQPVTAGLSATVAAAAMNGLNGNAHQSAAPAAATFSVGPQLAHQDGLTPDIAALAINIAAKSLDGAKHFDIRLDPPELGRVDVRLSVDNTGKAQAHLSVEKPQTLNLLQRDASSLQRSLRDTGVDLSNNGLQFSLKGQQQAPQFHAPASRGRALSVAAIAAPVSAPIHFHSFAHDRARLDIRV